MKYILFFLPVFLFGQTNCTKVTYSIQPKEWKNQKERDPFFDQMDALTKHIKYELVFDKEQSNFRYQKSLAIKENVMVNQYAELISEGSYYFVNDTVYKKEVFQDKLFYTYQPLKDQGFKWNFPDETKKIDQYICYKATRQVINTNVSGTHQFTVIAWYCPEIPVPFGPKDNFGLPGLILELEDTHIVFYAEKIELNKIECRFESYSDGSISLEELTKIKKSKS